MNSHYGKVWLTHSTSVSVCILLLVLCIVIYQYTDWWIHFHSVKKNLYLQKMSGMCKGPGIVVLACNELHSKRNRFIRKHRSIAFTYYHQRSFPWLQLAGLIASTSCWLGAKSLCSCSQFIGWKWWCEPSTDRLTSSSRNLLWQAPVNYLEMVRLACEID